MKNIINTLLSAKPKNINGLITIYINKAKRDKFFLENFIEALLVVEEKDFINQEKIRKIRYKFTEEMLNINDSLKE